MCDARPPARRSQVTLTTVFTICFGAALVAGLVLFLVKTRLSLTLALGSAMVAIALDHAVGLLTRRGMRRGLAIALVMVGIGVLLAGMGLLLIPPVVSQAKALAAEAPTLWGRVQHAPWFEHLDERFHVREALRQSAPAAADAVNPLLTAIGGVVSVAGGVLAFLFLAVFMLVFGGDLVKTVLDEVEPDRRERYERVFRKIYRSVGGYLGGLLGICAINATLTTTFLVVLRMPFFLPLGVLSGSSSLVPYAGPLVAGTMVTLFALATGGVLKALAVLVYFILYGQLEGNVLAPVIFRRTVHVNPLVTLLAVLFLVELMGVAGAILAVPVAAVVQIVAQELLAIRRERRTSRVARVES